MPRQYMQPQPGLFVGQSARQDMAQARARADQERIRQQRLQGFQYTGQARQAARTQREAQRAAQQQMAMASRERDADRQFQMQRDAFGARRDYAMQERRIQSAAEQAQFGRDFEREQQETRFGQQQDLAMQEQDYRLQQLDIAAQDQFLSAEQQAEIQRERDMLVSDMQRDTAREARAEQFGYGQMAADRAADRSSVAAREQAGISDWMDARHQGRAGDLARQQITQRHELGMEATRQRIDQESAARERLGKISHSQAIELRTMIGDQAFDAQKEDHLNALDRVLFNHDLMDQSKRNDKERAKATNRAEAREAEIGYRIRQLRQSGRFGEEDSPEFEAAVRNIRRDVGRLSDEEIGVGPSSQQQFDRAKVQEGDSVLVPTGNGYMKVHEAQPQFTTPGGETVKPNQWFPLGNQKVAFSRSGQLITAPPDPEQKTRDALQSYSLKKQLDYIHSEVETTDALGNKTSRPRFTHMEQQRMLQELQRQMSPATDTPEQGGGGWPGPQGWNPDVEAAPVTGQPTGDSQTPDRWGHTPGEADQVFNQTLEQMAKDPPNLEWAQHKRNLMRGRYKIGEPGEVPWEEWSPQDKAFYWKALQDLKALEDDEQVGMPAKAVSTPPPARKPASRQTLADRVQAVQETHQRKKINRDTLEKLERSQQGLPQEGDF